MIWIKTFFSIWYSMYSRVVSEFSDVYYLNWCVIINDERLITKTIKYCLYRKHAVCCCCWINRSTYWCWPNYIKIIKCIHMLSVSNCFSVFIHLSNIMLCRIRFGKTFLSSRNPTLSFLISRTFFLILPWLIKPKRLELLVIKSNLF